MKHNFREQSRKALKAAKKELDSLQDDRLKYAALELRMSMEALTYDRVQAYAAEIPPSEYQSWQPRKLMQLLLEIDPNADKNSSISVGIEKEYGKPATDMKSLGSEVVLNLATIKKHYDALGAFLHIPTLKQIETNSQPAPEKLRMRCEQLVSAIDSALASSVFNMTIGSFATKECVRCKAMMRRRLPLDGGSVNATCFNCGANYTVEHAGPNKSSWYPWQKDINCPVDNCSGTISLWEDERTTEGKCVACNTCDTEFRLGMGLFQKMDK